MQRLGADLDEAKAELEAEKLAQRTTASGGESAIAVREMHDRLSYERSSQEFLADEHSTTKALPLLLKLTLTLTIAPLAS